MGKTIGLSLLVLILAGAAAYCQALGGNWYWVSVGIILVNVPIGYYWLRSIIGHSIR